MAQEANRTEKSKGFFTGRNIAVIGCLLLIIFVIALIVVIFFGGALLSIPHDEGVSPGP
jgi:uncharacterized membrane protein